MKKSILSMLLLALPILVSAYDVKIDGIYYNLNYEKNEAEVTYREWNQDEEAILSDYSGEVIIPEKFTFEDENYTVTSIGDAAFWCCSGLTSVVIPNSVKSIGASTFEGCSNLITVTIPNSVTSIGDAAFWCCSSMTSVTIPNSVTSIGEGAFEGCSGLTSLYIDSNDIVSKVYYNIWDEEMGIGQHAFADCSSLSSVTIGNSVTNIGKYAFEGYKDLTTITLGNSVTSIGNYAFFDCSGLTSLDIPNSVTSIGDGSFSHCSGLTSITIPNSVTSIGDFAFSTCSGLTSVVIPNSVTSIGEAAFSNCKGLTSVHISDIAAWCKVELKINEEEVNYEGDLEYDSPYSVNPLYYAHHLFVDGKEISKLIIPEGVTEIKKLTFCGCSDLTSVSIPNTVSFIGEEAFLGCTSLTVLNLDCTTIEGWFSDFSSIENVILGNSVKSIGTEAFWNCSGLTSVTIPNSVTSIGDFAFFNCNGLTSITIPSSVTNIGGDAFYGCSGLSSVHIEDITAWLNIQYSFHEEEFERFYSNPLCYAHHLFIDEKEITNLIIPEGIENIKDYAFCGCEGLTSVTFPNSVTSIGWDAFSCCSGLTSVTIPNSVAYIGDKAFYGCKGLNEVFCYAEKVPHTYYSSTFYNCNLQKSTLYVPIVSLDEYKTTTPWSSFGTILPIEGYVYNLTYVVDGNVYTSYSLKEGESITPEAVPTKDGYTFSGWSEIPSTMPANNVTITGAFIANKYKLVYIVDGEDYISSEVDYGTAITPEEVPVKEGYTFSGWSEIPSTMPASDVTITGTFTVNKYTITYMVDDVKLMTEEVAYGSTIAPPKSQKDGYDILWSSHPTTMPAYNITIYGTYTTGIDSIAQEESERQVFTPDGKRVKTPQKGLNIIRTSDGKMKKVMVK